MTEEATWTPADDEPWRNQRRRRGKRWAIIGVIAGGTLIAAMGYSLVQKPFDPLRQLSGPGWLSTPPRIEDEDRAAALRNFVDGGHFAGRTPEQIATLFHLTPPAIHDAPFDHVYALYPNRVRRGPQANVRLGLKTGEDGRVTEAELLFGR